MTNGCLTGCALLISLLITTMFIFKKSVNNIETKIFKKMLLCNIFESITTTSIVIVAVTSNNNFILKLLNRLDVMLIILWCSLMCLYIYSISTNRVNKNIKRYIWSLNIIIFIFALFLGVNIINENGIMNSDGPLTYLGFIRAVTYIILMITILLVFKTKKQLDYNKYIPLFFLILMLIIVAILRLIIPEFNFISLVLSLVDMIMIFTIENPDIKLLNKVNLINKELEKSNKVKSDFLSSMSHEIRTPLNSVMGFSQLISESETLEEAKENAKDILNSANILLNMISNILDISNVDSNTLELQEVEYNLNDLINDVTNLFKYKIFEKKLNLKINISNTIPKILIGDAAKIKRIMANLIDNAVKYTDNGGIEINITNKNSKNICKLFIEVKDTGIGITKENLNVLFDRFTRNEEFVNSNRSGMGLGLSITKDLIEYMGGTIECESKVNEHTIFKIKLEQRVKKI